jgi:hypothetical protein
VAFALKSATSLWLPRFEKARCLQAQWRLSEKLYVFLFQSSKSMPFLLEIFSSKEEKAERRRDVLCR